MGQGVAGQGPNSDFMAGDQVLRVAAMLLKDQETTQLVRLVQHLNQQVRPKTLYELRRQMPRPPTTIPAANQEHSRTGIIHPNNTVAIATASSKMLKMFIVLSQHSLKRRKGR